MLAPEEYVDQLSNLWQDAKPSPYENVKLQIEDTLGQKMDDIFSCKPFNYALKLSCSTDFNPVPISAASVGQVHDAVLKNGEKVAVKVF